MSKEIKRKSVPQNWHTLLPKEESCVCKGGDIMLIPPDDQTLPFTVFTLGEEDPLDDFRGWKMNREADTIRYNPADPDGGPMIEYRESSGLSAHSSNGRPRCDFKPWQRLMLILKRYAPSNYRGAIFPINGNRPYTLDSIQCKREGNLSVVKENGRTIFAAKKQKKAKPFNQKAALLNHVTDGANLGIYFRKKECKLIAFDLDTDSSEKGEIEEHDESLRFSVSCMIYVLHKLGLSPFLYLSGKKGYHCEVFFDKPISREKLNTLNNIILTKHREFGGTHIDVVYPSGRSYRVFGCFHYKTGNFTHALKIDEIKEINDKSISIHWSKVDYNESWKLFAGTPDNKAEIVDEIIAAHPDIIAPPKIDKKTRRHNANYAPKGIYYNRDIIKTIHERGLFGEHHRYLSAFQLGRYFRQMIGLSKEEAGAEIVIWLKRHFVEQCTRENGLISFEGALTKKIKSSYEDCVEETIQNCLNGYNSRILFKREIVEIYHNSAYQYISELRYTRKQISALLALLGYAEKYSSLNLYISYNYLLKIFNVGNRNTVHNWLKMFREDNIFIPINAAIRKKRKPMRYRLLLPEDCYDVLPTDEHDSSS
jgi:hypothetical protein